MDMGWPPIFYRRLENGLRPHLMYQEVVVRPSRGLTPLIYGEIPEARFRGFPQSV